MKGRPNMPVTILVVDDHDVLREGIRSILQRARPQWQICAEASSGSEAIDVASRLNPTVILLDITMPGISGLEVASRISAVDPDCKILMVTMHESGELTNDARRVGARGYITKVEAARMLVPAIEALLSGGTFFGSPSENPDPGPAPGVLSLSLLLRAALAS